MKHCWILSVGILFQVCCITPHWVWQQLLSTHGLLTTSGATVLMDWQAVLIIKLVELGYCPLCSDHAWWLLGSKLLPYMSCWSEPDPWCTAWQCSLHITDPLYCPSKKQSLMQWKKKCIIWWNYWWVTITSFWFHCQAVSLAWPTQGLIYLRLIVFFCFSCCIPF